MAARHDDGSGDGNISEHGSSGSGSGSSIELIFMGLSAVGAFGTLCVIIFLDLLQENTAALVFDLGLLALCLIVFCWSWHGYRQKRKVQRRQAQDRKRDG